jgi:hypothetical protein
MVTPISIKNYQHVCELTKALAVYLLNAYNTNSGKNE